ncbi:hypothetical protein AVEN_136843-1, partial [Araneus ventricosus]
MVRKDNAEPQIVQILNFGQVDIDPFNDVIDDVKI